MSGNSVFHVGAEWAQEASPRYFMRRIEPTPVKADPVELLKAFFQTSEGSDVPAYRKTKDAVKAYLDSLKPPQEEGGRRRADWGTFDGKWKRANGYTGEGKICSQRWCSRRFDSVTRKVFCGFTVTDEHRWAYQAGKKA